MPVIPRLYHTALKEKIEGKRTGGEPERRGKNTPWKRKKRPAKPTFGKKGTPAGGTKENGLEP
jgi:hypothetical protein